MESEKRNCNQICPWNDPSDGCVRPKGRVCPLSNTEPDASGWGQVKENKKRLIDANALMDAFRSHMVEKYDRNKCTLEENCKTCEPGCLWRKKVSEAPTVDAVEVVHGRWEKAEYCGYVRCDQCKDVYIDESWLDDGRWHYCPNCGAVMDGGNEDG